MNNYVPLTKEDVFFIDDIDGTTPKNIEFVPLKRLMSAVAWRNNLERVPHSEFYACSFCASNMHAEVIIEDKIKQSKKYACSVCATNKAFGIENKEKNGVDE